MPLPHDLPSGHGGEQSGVLDPWTEETCWGWQPTLPAAASRSPGMMSEKGRFILGLVLKIDTIKLIFIYNLFAVFR